MCGKNTAICILEEAYSACASIFKEYIKEAYLYGSYARGDYNENSDIDIMILTSYKDDEIRIVKKILHDIAFDFEMDYGVDISVILKNEEHFYYWVDALPFYNNIQKEGVILSGK